MESIKKLIYDGQVDEAIQRLNSHIESHPEADEAYYLRGNAYRKLGDNRMALNNYLQAIALNPDSPAQEAHNMLIRILDYYNKDVYNP